MALLQLVYSNIRSKTIILLLFSAIYLNSQIPKSIDVLNPGAKKIHESKTGSYYSTSDNKELIWGLDSFLGSKTERIFELFKHEMSKPVKFEFYRNENEILCNCGWDTNKVTLIYERLGCAKYDHKIQMAEPGSSGRTDSIYTKWGGFYKVVFHHYIHLLLYDIAGEKKHDKIPKFLSEGLAVYFSQQLKFNKRIKTVITEKSENHYLPSIEELLSDKKIATFPNIHHWSFLLCQYIIDIYGWDKMLEIINDPEHFYKVMGKTKNEVNDKWYNYLKRKYPDN